MVSFAFLSVDFEANSFNILIFSKSTIPSLKLSNRILELPPGYTKRQSPAGQRVSTANPPPTAGQGLREHRQASIPPTGGGSSPRCDTFSQGEQTPICDGDER